MTSTPTSTELGPDPERSDRLGANCVRPAGKPNGGTRLATGKKVHGNHQMGLAPVGGVVVEDGRAVIVRRP